MRKQWVALFGLIFMLGFGASDLPAGELVYTPVNPNFGGSPFNGAPLLNNANAQNNFEAPPEDTLSSAREFAQRLDDAILNALSFALTNNIVDFQTGKFTPGTFQSGINTIVVSTSGNSTFVNITNNETGETSVIEVPN